MIDSSIYKRIFMKHKEYNVHDIDKDRYDFVIDGIIDNDYNKIIDISSGRGSLIKHLRNKKQDIHITSTDIHKFNNLDVEFIQLDLTKKDDLNKITETYDMLSCLDVLEHIEEKHINDVLLAFKKISNHFCFTVANHSEIIDRFELHLIQKNKDWWDEIFENHFTIINSFVKYDDRSFCYTLKNK